MWPEHGASPSTAGSGNDTVSDTDTLLSHDGSDENRALKEASSVGLDNYFKNLKFEISPSTLFESFSGGEQSST